MLFLDIDDKSIDYQILIGYLNSKVTMFFLSILAPTLDFNQGPLRKLPLIVPNYIKNNLTTVIGKTVKNNIYLSGLDWDFSETSWDFAKHPLLTKIADHTQKSPPQQRFYT